MKVVPEIPTVSLSLANLPEIVQCGLCVHGARAVESFTQHGLWSLHVYHYAGTLTVNGTAFPYGPGWASLLPPECEGTWGFPAHAPHYYAHFRTPNRGLPATPMPMLRNLRENGARFSRAMEELVAFFQADRMRAHVRLWDLLFGFADGHENETSGHSTSTPVQIAISIIRNAGSAKLNVANIAKQMGVSHNHLTRLFKRQFGCGVGDYIRNERVTRAKQLLSETRLPMKSIAYECGFASLQLLNKAIRAATGHTPTDLRNGIAAAPGSPSPGADPDTND